MEIGNFCDDPPGKNLRCEAEERSHMALWCIVSSPLILGFNMSDATRMDRVWPTITNREAIAVDHAWAGSPGALSKNFLNGTIELWSKPLPGREVAIVLLNLADTHQTLSLSTSDDIPGAPRGASYRSIWDHKTVPIQGSSITVSLTPHDCLFAVLSETTGRWFDLL